MPDGNRDGAARPLMLWRLIQMASGVIQMGEDK